MHFSQQAGASKTELLLKLLLLPVLCFLLPVAVYAAAPTVITYSPADGATTVATTANLVLTFSEAISKTGTGFVTILQTSDDSVVEQIGTATGAVTGSGTDTITINPTSDFTEQGYYVQIDARAFYNAGGENYLGIADTTTWNFTVDATAPTVSAYSPANGETSVARNSNLVLTFSENIGKTGTGFVTIYKTSDDSVVEQIGTATGAVTGSGTDTITINPTTVLNGNTTHYVKIDAMAFYDETGISYAGISDTTTWEFTTAASPRGNSGYRQQRAQRMRENWEKMQALHAAASEENPEEDEGGNDDEDVATPEQPDIRQERLMTPVPDTPQGQEYVSPFHERVCNRVNRRFAGIQKIIDRVNRRLRGRFGFTCE